MKVKCKLNVQDKYTGTMYEANKEYDLTKERAKEVVSAYNGRYFEYVQVVKETNEAITSEYGDTKVVIKKDSIELNTEPTEEVKPKRVRKSTKK